jgi:hypothetical protein
MAFASRLVSRFTAPGSRCDDRPMRDLAEIDRALEQLGPVPKDVGALIARVLGPDRSPAALESALSALGVESAVIGAPQPAAPRITTPRPPPFPRSTPLPAAASRREPSERPSSSHDTMEQWPADSLPAAPGAVELDSATEDLLGAAEPAYATAAEDDEPELSLGAQSDAPPEHGEHEAAPLSTRQLLDRELDPREFPSSPPQRNSTTPPVAADDAAEEDDFEMLIEDEEILEIQEDDVETDESDDP